jgi:rhodanese-related sulfurtransferase
MRFALYVTVLALLGAAVLSGCNSAEQKKPEVAAAKKATSPPDDGVRRVSAQEAQELVAKGQAVIIDVRNQAAFDQGHIQGAKLIPFNEIQNRASELPKDKTIVTYCSWPNEHTSAGSVVTLKSKGFDNAVALLGGYAAWQSAGFPIEHKATDGTTPVGNGK